MTATSVTGATAGIRIRGLAGKGTRTSDVQLWRDAVVTATELDLDTKGLLLLMAGRMNADGTRCYPGLPWLMAAAGKGRSWAYVTLTRAVRAGYLGRVEGTGHRGSNAEFHATVPRGRLVVTGAAEDGSLLVQRDGKGHAVIVTTAFEAVVDKLRAQEQARVWVRERGPYKDSEGSASADPMEPKGSAGADERVREQLAKGPQARTKGSASADPTSYVPRVQPHLDRGAPLHDEGFPPKTPLPNLVTPPLRDGATDDDDNKITGRGACPCCGRAGMRGPAHTAKCWTCYRREVNRKPCTHEHLEMTGT